MATHIGSDKRYIALDVECVATGRRHDARAICYVAVVDYDENILLQKLIKPDLPVFSYLTPLTGVKAGDLDRAENPREVIAQVKPLLGPDVILVGQSVRSDIVWLTLEEGKDYGGTEDIADIFKTYNPRYSNYTHYSLRHEANTLLSRGFLTGDHDPVQESIASMKLFKTYSGKPQLIAQAKAKLASTLIEPSVARRYKNNYEGVCLGLKKSCFCGAPHKFK